MMRKLKGSIYVYLNNLNFFLNVIFLKSTIYFKSCSKYQKSNLKLLIWLFFTITIPSSVERSAETIITDVITVTFQ